ncbi:hypothetical protein HID58_002231 [Brassica napus]|uniref:Uncharacterized protein n=2 Tax=Brassica napus TaxID=3708 RepID=A0ABQ8ELX7_BRANA|nr:hypothetical protein HID58_002231 [Brassica napus]
MAASSVMISDLRLTVDLLRWRDVKRGKSGREMDMRRCKRKNMEIGRRDSYYIVVSYSFLMRGLGGTLALR